MSDETKRNPEPLQFDTAEPAADDSATATSPACTACSTDIKTSYFEINGEIVCMSCRAKLRAQLTGGSGSERVARAVGFGLIAAAIGSALFYGIGLLTGYYIGFVAIVIGVLVGRAVNVGSRGRGGRAYQFLAVGLTYFAIVAIYIPDIIKEVRAARTSAIAAADSTAKASGAKPTPVGEVELQGTPTPSAAATKAELAPRKRTIGQHALRIVALLALAALVPIIGSFDNPIYLLVIGFAVFEAWRQNRRLHLAITGPYRVGAPRGINGAPEAASG
jgi:hypothetical protein